MPKNIGIRLYKRDDSEYWQYYIRYQGVTYRGSTNEKDRKKAEDRAFHIQYGLSRHAGIEKAGNISIDECIDKYFEYLSDFRRETIKTYRAYIKNLVEFLLKRYPRIKLMKEITPDMIESFKAYKLRECSRTTVHNQIKGFKAMFNWAMERNLITENSLAKVRNLSKKQIRETQKPVEILTLEELGKFVDYTKKHYPELYPLYMVWMYTGARKNELFTLEWKDVDFKNKIIRIRYKENFIPKTDERTLPLHNRLIEILKAIPRKGNYVFMDGKKPFMYPDKTKSKGVYESHKPYRYLAKIMKAIGKPNFTRIHWLRHSYATIIAKEKGIKFAQEVLGHTDIRVTMRYIHLDRDYLQENLNKIKALDRIFK
ncbi:MAG: tyrosine-type recombinase/integrase [Candidatus Omnitrophica bacterium]|nr:tyrosine-type recombinase/integrase [Candidatus Omnitrophota bacterium]